MPAVYENLGVRFLYPESWKLTEDEREAWPRSVTIQSPETSFWSLHVYPPAQPTQPLIDDLVSMMQEEFNEVEVLPAREVIGDAMTTGVDLSFFYLDLLVEAKIRCLRTPSATLIWFYQAESREFEDMEPVFRAIATSLLQTQIPLPD